MRFASLGSGSEGNALVIESNQTRVMLDCGFGLRDMCARLAVKSLAAEQINAIVVTHEHSDHISGAVRFARKYGTALWMTHGTLQQLARQQDKLPDIRIIDSHCAFEIDDIAIQPFPVPHDAREPVQFVFSDGQFRLGILTDTGAATRHIIDILTGCDALVLECNHDSDMLRDSHYPASLKQRISGQFGHLDNLAAANLLARLDHSKLQHLIAAHLSQHNNSPERALAVLAQVLGCQPHWLNHADQTQGFSWRSLAAR